MNKLRRKSTVIVKAINSLPDEVHEWLETLFSTDISDILEAIHAAATTNPDSLNPQFTVKQPVTESAKSAGSARIGQSGEITFEEICESLPSNYAIINTAKVGHAGDFIIEFTINGRTYRCLVEIKLYQANVPQKEVAKFKNDISFGNYDAGLIISYKSKFPRISKSLHIENMRTPYGAIPVMYLSKMPREHIIKCIEILCERAVNSTIKSIQIDISDSITYINTVLDLSGSTRRLLNDLQTMVGTKIQKCTENLISCEIQIKTALNKLLERVAPSVHGSKEDFKPLLSDPSKIYDPMKPAFNSEPINTSPRSAATHSSRSSPTSVSRVSESRTSANLIVDTCQFREEDVKLVHSLINLTPNAVTQTSKKVVIPLHNVELVLLPLKSKTNLSITFREEPSKKYDTILLMCRKGRKANSFVATLSQKIINLLYAIYK